MNPLILEQTIKRIDYNGLSDMEYLARSISTKSRNEIIDQFLGFTKRCVDEGWVNNSEKETLIKVQLTLLGLLTNLGTEDMMYAYHADTQERDNHWRVQVFFDVHLSGLDKALRECPLCKFYDIYLGERRGLLPKIKVYNGELIITLIAYKNPNYCY